MQIANPGKHYARLIDLAHDVRWDAPRRPSTSRPGSPAGWVAWIEGFQGEGEIATPKHSMPSTATRPAAAARAIPVGQK